MEKRLIASGLLAGLVGAVLAFVFARLCAEPIIGRAIAYEDGRTEAEQAHGVHEHGVELFTRGVQANAGLGFGVLLFGLAMGALFAVVFCLVYVRAENPVPPRPAPGRSRSSSVYGRTGPAARLPAVPRESPGSRATASPRSPPCRSAYAPAPNQKPRHY